jgi:hypothetical protein
MHTWLRIWATANVTREMFVVGGGSSSVVGTTEPPKLLLIIANHIRVQVSYFVPSLFPCSSFL